MIRNAARERVGEEHGPVALADRQRAAELRLGERPEDQTDDAGRHGHAQHAHAEADHADQVEQDQVDDVVVQRVGAERREHQDAGIELRPRDGQHLHPQADQRQVEQEQHDVADVEARDQAPDQVRLGGEQQRSRLQAELLERGEQDRGGGRGRQPERQQRHQHARGGGVVGRLGPGHALDRALAELLGPPGEALLHHVGEKGRDLGAARRQRAEREAERGAAQPRLPRARPVLEAHPDRAPDRRDLLRLVAVAAGDVERLADREQADHDHDHVDAVQQLRDAEREARLAGLGVDADQAERQAEEQAREAARERAAEDRGDRGEGQHHQREVGGGAEPQRDLHHQRRDEGQRQGRDRAGDERADRRGRERRAAAALARHQVALERGHDGRRLAGRVEQDRGGRAAVHGAVVDAGEHDEGGGRVEVEGDRQQQGDGQRRPDPGQHAHGRAERDPDRRPHQVEGRERDGEALAERGERLHPRKASSCLPPGRPYPSSAAQHPGRQTQPQPEGEGDVGGRAQRPGRRRR